MPNLRASYARWHLLTPDGTRSPGALIQDYKQILSNTNTNSPLSFAAKQISSIKDNEDYDQKPPLQSNIVSINGHYQQYDDLEKWSFENTKKGLHLPKKKSPKVRRIVSNLSTDFIHYLRTSTIDRKPPKRDMKDGSGNLGSKIKEKPEGAIIEAFNQIDCLKQKIDKSSKKYEIKKEKLKKVRAINSELNHEKMHYLELINALKLEKFIKSNKKNTKNKGKIVFPAAENFFSLSVNEQNSIKAYAINQKVAEYKDALNRKLSQINENKFKVKTLKEKCDYLKTEICKAKFSLYEYLNNILSGNDKSVQKSLSWAIKEIWGIGYKVDPLKIPKILDKESIAYLFSIAQKEVELDKLLNEKQKVVLRIKSIYFGPEQQQTYAPLHSKMKKDVHIFCQTTCSFITDPVSKKPSSMKVIPEKALIYSVSA